MEGVDIVLVGAEAVVENGGIINKLGTYQLSIVARSLNKARKLFDSFALPLLTALPLAFLCCGGEFQVYAHLSSESAGSGV